jgi:hypothetical protein
VVVSIHELPRETVRKGSRVGGLSSNCRQADSKRYPPSCLEEVSSRKLLFSVSIVYLQE